MILATNGQGAAQDIFLNGTFVTYNVSGTLDYKYQSAFVDKDDGSSHNMDVRFSFITHVSVGVYDSNNAGREQIAYVVAQKDGGSNIYSGGNHDDYAYMVAVSGGSSYDDKTSGGEIVSYGGVKGYSTSGLDGDYNSEDDYEFHDVGIPKDSTKNLVLVAVDIDNDGTVGKYIGKEYTYTDPNVLAVLQAPPYFDELKEGGYGDAGTTYAFTTSYTIGQTSGNTSSFSVGISSEVAVPGLKVAIGSGYNGTWEEEFTEAFTESFTTIFTATSENMVVMQRTPVIIYKYLLQNKNGKFPSTGGEFGANGNVMTIAVPSQPVYALATVDEYNGYVDKYTDMMKSVDKNEYTPMNTVKKIGDQYLKDNEGDPSAYRPNWSGGTAYGNLTSVTSNTGVITSEYSASSEQTQEKSSSHGFYFDMTVSAGAIAVVGEVWAGVSAGTEHNWSQGSFTTTTTTTTTSGSVANLGESGLDPNILKNYGFNWQFGKWEINIGKGKTPVYGYSVSTIRTGAPVPQNLTVEDAVTPAGGEAAKLTWDAINGATYKVYLLNDGASPTVFETDDASYIFEIPADTRRHSFTFQVSTVVGDQESVLSSSVTYYRKSYGMSAYDIAVQNGFEGTEDEWLASLIGTDGIDGVGVEKAEINENGELIIILTDGTQIDLGTVVGATGEAGVGIVSVYINSDGELEILLTDGSEMNLGTVIGKDGITPQLRINSETNEWEVSLDDGVTWETTGVKATGEKGEQGDPGVGIETVELDAENSDETKSVYIITLTDGYTYSFTVNHGEDGATGAKGDPGANGITPQLRINSETNEWEVSLDDGITWESTGVKATGAKGEKGDKGDTGEKGDKGDAGVGIQSATLDQNGNLIITLTDDTVQNLGKIIGADGTDGKDGVGVKSAALDQNGNLIITLTDDTVLNLGTVLGINGKDGKDGATPFIGENGNWWIGETDTGVRATPIDVSEITLDDEGNMIYTLSDGTTKNAGSVANNAAIQAMAGVAEGGVTQEDLNTVKILATVATILSAVSLLWNVISLFALISKKKKSLV